MSASEIWMGIIVTILVCSLIVFLGVFVADIIKGWKEEDRKR